MPPIHILPPRFEGTIVLPDGRALGYAEYGPTKGRPLIWFHGTPGARRQISPEAREAAHDRGVRLIAVERPGIGASTPYRYDAVAKFAHDIEHFANALELEHFAISGLSGGGPYALACAYHMPDRVVATAVLGGVAPTVGPDAAEGGTSTLTRFFSPMLGYTHRPLGVAMRRIVRVLTPVSHQAIDLFASFMPPGDQRVFEDPRVRHMFTDDIIIGTERYMEAFLLDVILFGRDWGFELRDIAGPVHLWYGDADNIVPIEHGAHLRDRIPNSELRVRPDEGHLGGLGAAREIMDALLKDWDEAASSF